MKCAAENLKSSFETLRASGGEHSERKRETARRDRELAHQREEALRARHTGAP